jgi:DNA-binding NtrC family response regulator
MGKKILVVDDEESVRTSVQMFLENKRLWRANNLNQMKTYGMIQHYRSKQKALALRYLENDDFKHLLRRFFIQFPLLHFPIY